MITVLVVDQVVRLRQGNSRARAVAIQVAILMTQANIASRAVSQVLAGSGDRGRAYEEFRTYTMMVLAVAPVLMRYGCRTAGRRAFSSSFPITPGDAI
jgi:hypothetical protein